MAKTQNMGPESGLTPYLTVKGAKDAIAFYKSAFKAKEHFRMPAEDGERLMHAHVEINGASLMLADDFPEHHGGGASPAPAGVALHLQVKDADKWWTRAVDAGASVVMPLADMFWGDRFGQLRDPYGHVWSISSPLKGAAKKAAALTAPSMDKASAPAKSAAKTAKPAKSAAKKSAAKTGASAKKGGKKPG